MVNFFILLYHFYIFFLFDLNGINNLSDSDYKIFINKIISLLFSVLFRFIIFKYMPERICLVYPSSQCSVIFISKARSFFFLLIVKYMWVLEKWQKEKRVGPGKSWGLAVWEQCGLFIRRVWCQKEGNWKRSVTG